MGNIPVVVGARVESIGGYRGQVNVYDKKCQKALENNRYGVLPNGSLAWPGEPELLESYGVRVEDISLEFEKIIELINLQEQENLSNPNVEDKDVTYCAIENYDVVKTRFPPDEIFCEYCQTSTIFETTCKITNLWNQETVTLTDYRWHKIKQHGDLGNSKTSRLLPEKFCNVLSLGNTNLLESDPLFKVAKYYNLNFDDLEDQMVKDGDLFILPATLMMSSTSGRGRKTDDDSF